MSNGVLTARGLCYWIIQHSVVLSKPLRKRNMRHHDGVSRVDFLAISILYTSHFQ
jgi:hypothetical protein